MIDNSNDFILKVKAMVDSQNIEKQLKEISAKQKFSIKADGTKELIREITKIKDETGKVYKSTVEYKNEASKTAKEVKKVAQEQDRLLQKVKLSTEQMNKMQINAEKVFKDYNKGGKQAQEETSRLKNEMKTISEEMKKQISLSGQLDKSTVDSLKKRQQLANAQLQTMKATNAGDTSGGLKGFSDVLGKVGLFGSATAVIGTLTTVATSATKSIFELNEAITEFTKVSDYSGDKLQGYVDLMFEMGQEIGRTGQEVLQASTDFLKSGYSEQDSATLGKVATMYTNISDAEISASESASFIIAQMKAFNIEAKDAIVITDSINEVSNRFAVSSEQLASSVGKSSAVLANAGVTFSEQLGLITSGTEILRDADKVSNGLKTISLRLQGNLVSSPVHIEMCA